MPAPHPPCLANDLQVRGMTRLSYSCHSRALHTPSPAQALYCLLPNHWYMDTPLTTQTVKARRDPREPLIPESPLSGGEVTPSLRAKALCPQALDWP